MTLPIRVPADFRIIAHRGASAYAPENTASAFRLAHEMAVREVETDAQLSVDGQVVLCHDRDLVRYGHGPLVVEEMSWSNLACLDMGSWYSPHLYGGERMWRLDDLFEAYKDRFTYHVELKGVSALLAPAVHACMLRHGLVERCIATSFRFDALTAMRAVDANMRLGWLVEEITEQTLAGARALKLFQLCPRAVKVTEMQVALARQVTQEVRAWGLSGNREEVQDLIVKTLNAGCDGTTTDWPDWLSV